MRKRPKISENTSDLGGYEVGFGKPPKASRFPKGQSGNPAGRPKRGTSLDDLMAKHLDKTYSITINGARTPYSGLEALVMSLVTSAIAGNYRSQKLVMEHLQRSQSLVDEKPSWLTGAAERLRSKLRSLAETPGAEEVKPPKGD